MKQVKKLAEVRFVHTGRAIKRIKQASLRKDFTEMLAGVELCLAHRQKRVARKCVQAMVAMAIGLNRTISPAVTVGILDGLLKDGKSEPLLRRAGGVVDTHNDQRCVVGTGTTIGSCQSKTNMTCYTIVGTEGCGGPSGFRLPWTGVFAVRA